MRIEHLRADVFGLGELSLAALSGKLELPGLQVARRLAHITRPTERLVPDERAHLSRWLEERVSAYSPPVAVLDAIRSLTTPGACFVVCGQQPGLFSAPLFTLWKALQTIRLARELSADWGVPVVPLFWNHADDHDVAEVHHGYVVNPNFDVQKVSLTGLSSGRMPLSRIEFDEQRHGLAALRALLSQLYGYMPGIDAAIELFVPRAGETFATAFTRVLFELLGHSGLVVLEPDWLREELSHQLAALVGAGLPGALREGERALAVAGYEPSIASREAALLYRVDAAGRRPMRLVGEDFAYDDEPGSRTAAELAAEIVQEPAAWSAGALLRPLVQDLALPVAAYVGGPGELAYHAQLAGARAALDLPAPAFVPRVSVTLVDAECEASLQKLGATVADVLSARGAYEHATQAPSTPQPVDALRHLARETRQRLLELRDELDPALVGPLKRTAHKLEETLTKFGDKVARVEANKRGKGHRHLRRVNSVLCPRGQAQERVLGPLSFVASYGPGWIEALGRELDPFASEHHAVFLGEHPEPPRPAAEARNPREER